MSQRIQSHSRWLNKVFTYDEADRLKKLTVKEDDKLTLTQENRYNGSGQRISKAETKPVKGLDGETTETTKTDYYYQDGTVLYTKDTDGNRSSMNLLGTSANVIATSRGTGDAENWYLYNKDIRESTTSIIDAKGSAAATYQYDDFGNTTITNGADFDNEICYTGQIYDKSSGLYYYNARYYDPENARFITQDTYRGEATQPDTLHLYAYCANNPINYTDPSGHLKLKLPKWVPKWIKKRVKWIPGIRKHYSRNRLNKPLPKNEKEAKRQKYKKYSYIASICHQFGALGKPNKKYVDRNGYKEVVYNSSGKKIVWDERNKGTYNFGSSKETHFWKDVVPWLAWGNSRSDTTTRSQRIDTFSLYSMPIAKRTLKAILKKM